MSVRSIHQFAEKVAFVTDCTNPIGRAVALQLALQGSYIVAGVPPSAATGRTIADELRELGTLAHVVEFDPDNADAAEHATAAVDELFGRLDSLINCTASASEELDPASTEKLINAARRLMEGRPKPRIVNISFRMSTDDASDLEAPPSAIAALTRAFVAELPPNFRINCVSASMSAPAPDDAARVVTFLLSSEAAALNGQVLRVA